MQNYVKVLFGKKSGADSNLIYKIDEVNIANNWNPDAKNPKEFGGFNFSIPQNIIRWIHRGDTIYDVTLPTSAQIVNVAEGVFRSNKIILKNPRKVTDDMALELYEISDLQKQAYYKTLAAVSIMGYSKTANKILRDKVNYNNIDDVLIEWNDFMSKDDGLPITSLARDIESALYEIKDDRLITLFIDRPPCVETITSDKVINVTGESGSGKSTYIKNYFNDENYIIVDTDILFSDSITEQEEILNLRKIFKDDSKEILVNDFDGFYIRLLDYFTNSDKTIVIDSAQFRNIKNYSILKGKMIIMRTSIDTCYERCINRYSSKNIKIDFLEEKKYKDKKMGMYKWYKSLNEFIKNVYDNVINEEK